MKLRHLCIVATTAGLIVGCGQVRTSGTLPRLPVARALPMLGAASARGAADVAGPSFGAIEYRRGAPLPRLAATAPAYDLGSGGSSGDRHRIAAALGLTDSDRHLFLAAGGRGWSFDANCEAPAGVDVSGTEAPGADGAVGFTCASSAMIAPAGVACGGSPDVVCSTPKPIEPVRPVNLPSRQGATERVRTLFHALGVNPTDSALHVTDAVTEWLVSADPEIDGVVTTGRTMSATVGPDAAILAARGSLGTPKKLGDYPLVDASTVGFERLVQEEATRPRPMIASAMPCRSDTPNCGGPPTPEVVTITGVHLALEQVGTKLVPAFVFEAGPDQPVPPVPAVTSDLLETTDAPGPGIGPPQGPGGVAPGRPPSEPSPGEPTGPAPGPPTRPGQGAPGQPPRGEPVQPLQGGQSQPGPGAPAKP